MYVCTSLYTQYPRKQGQLGKILLTKGLIGKYKTIIFIFLSSRPTNIFSLCVCGGGLKSLSVADVSVCSRRSSANGYNMLLYVGWSIEWNGRLSVKKSKGPSEKGNQTTLFNVCLCMYIVYLHVKYNHYVPAWMYNTIIVYTYNEHFVVHNYIVLGTDVRYYK